MDQSTCCDCAQTKSHSHFYRALGQKPLCLDCHHLRRERYQQKWLDKSGPQTVDNPLSWKAKNKERVAKYNANYKRQNRDKYKEYNQRYRDKNLDYYRKDRKSRKLSNSDYVFRLKERTPCADCRKRFPPVCMDFDHLPQHTKAKNVSQMMNSSRSALEAEISKCDIVCSNCHRIRSLTRTGRTRPLTLDSFDPAI